MWRFFFLCMRRHFWPAGEAILGDAHSLQFLVVSEQVMLASASGGGRRPIEALSQEAVLHSDHSHRHRVCDSQRTETAHSVSGWDAEIKWIKGKQSIETVIT